MSTAGRAGHYPELAGSNPRPRHRDRPRPRRASHRRPPSCRPTYPCAGGRAGPRARPPPPHLPDPSPQGSHVLIRRRAVAYDEGIPLLLRTTRDRPPLPTADFRIALAKRASGEGRPVRAVLVRSSDEIVRRAGYRSRRESKRRGPGCGEKPDSASRCAMTCFRVGASARTTATPPSRSQVAAEALEFISSTRSSGGSLWRATRLRRDAGRAAPTRLTA